MGGIIIIKDSVNPKEGKTVEKNGIDQKIPYDPGIPLLGTYPEKTKTLVWKDMCTSMFIGALFTIA